MRKIQLFVLSVVVVLFTACHGNLWDAIEDLDARVARLEELCKEMNTNITSLQTIVSVIQENDVITGITPIEKGGKVIGYTIMFGKHDPITIYNGEDGKDGQNGSGSTPIIGVAKDTDGLYYWTLNGEWLLDDEGNKLPVSGKNGNDGENGEGSDGENGTIGKDGVTPQLKIENGYWYVSYDNGSTWTELGKAVGEDGKDGTNGTDGKDGQDGKPGADGKNGDSMFMSVTCDDNNVYFTLTDGSVLIVPRGNSTSDFDQTVIDNLVNSLTLDKNEIHLVNIGDKDTIIATTAPFPNSKVIWISNDTTIAKVVDGVIEGVECGIVTILVKAGTLSASCKVFVYGGHEYVDLGLGVKWATCNVGADSPEEYGDYFAWGEVEPKDDYSWGTYKWCDYRNSYPYLNKYKGAGDILYLEDDAANVNWKGMWRMPTMAELDELKTKCTWIWITENEVNGYKVIGVNGNSIFLPTTVSDIGYYWSSSVYGVDRKDAMLVKFSLDEVSLTNRGRCNGCSIRPVCQ